MKTKFTSQRDIDGEVLPNGWTAWFCNGREVTSYELELNGFEASWYGACKYTEKFNSLTSQRQRQRRNAVLFGANYRKGWSGQLC